MHSSLPRHFAIALVTQLKSLGLHCNVMSLKDGTADVLGGTSYKTLTQRRPDGGPVGLFTGLTFRVFAVAGTFLVSCDAHNTGATLSQAPEAAATEILRLIHSRPTTRTRSSPPNR